MSFEALLQFWKASPVTDTAKAAKVKAALNTQLSAFLASILKTENGIVTGKDEPRRVRAEAALQSFLLSFASRAASRERLHIFTTNYDRLIEHGADSLPACAPLIGSSAH